MQISILLLGLSAAHAFSKSESRSAVDFTHWAAPGANDVRSPCPALNSLANHGILPHSGKGITLAMLQDAFSALNVGADIAQILFTGTAVLGLTHDGAFDLETLDKHNAIEHDGSLSRAD